MRDQFRLLMQEHSRAERSDFSGQIMSKVYWLPFDSTGELMPTAHVAVNLPTGIMLMSHIPIAANNLELRHVGIGSPVKLKRSRSGRVEIVGLDKRAPGDHYKYTLNISTASLTSGNVSGFSASLLTYIQLTSYGSGYGAVPFGATAILTTAGSLVAFT